MICVDIVERRPLHRERFAYCAHPHLVAAADGAWLLVFNRAPRRDIILHPPQDPDYRNLLMRSEDEGRSWSTPSVAPSYDWCGVECAGLTALKSGRILLNQWRFEWLPLPAARASLRSDLVAPEALFADLAASRELDDFSPGATARAPRAFPWARGGGATAVQVSDDGGFSFAATHLIDVAPFSGGYGMRGGVELPNGEILLPLSDVPQYRRVFAVRSKDGGETWSPPRLIAASEGHEFEEPATLVLSSGKIVMLLRDNATRILHSVTSEDRGATWTTPKPTGILGYPAHLLQLADGRLACVVGRRQRPFGIALHLSSDGVTWDSRGLSLVDDLPNKDLGYPTAAQQADGNLVVVYYAQDAQGVTGIDTVIARLS